MNTKLFSQSQKTTFLLFIIFLAFINNGQLFAQVINDWGFTTSQHCAGQPTQFTISDTDGIDSVYWKFKDFGNALNDTSTLLSPAYTYSGPGTYMPELTIYSGLLYITVRDTVVIHHLPVPQLGNDTVFCPGAPIDITLDAGPGDFYNWNGSFTPGSQTLSVTDTGTYFVKVKHHGCSAYDTIHIARYEQATVDLSNVFFTNSNCSQSDGSITNIVFAAIPPFTIVWENAAGVQVGSDPDLLSVPAGMYFATVNYGSNCFQSFGPYLISDNSVPRIECVLVFNDVNSQGIGSITIMPESHNPADYSYSIDDGLNYLANNGLFTGLNAGVYILTLKDQAGCISEMLEITLENIGIQIITTPATGNNPNGSFTVIAVGENLTYQLQGYPPQTSNVFTGLFAGTYMVTVTDAFGQSYNLTFVIESILGLAEQENLPLIVGPIPASDFVTIESAVNILKCDLISTSGTILQSLNTEGKSAKIDISRLRCGIYLVRIYTAAGIAVRKIVKL